MDAYILVHKWVLTAIAYRSLLTSSLQGRLVKRARRYGDRLEAAPGRELERLERALSAEALAHNETEHQGLRGDVACRYADIACSSGGADLTDVRAVQR